MKKSVSLFILLSLCFLGVFAQPAQRLITVSVAPDSETWLYKAGDKAKFNIAVKKNGIAVRNAEVKYELSFDMLPPFKEETAVLKDGALSLDAGTMKNPGFLRCRVFATVDGVRYEGRGTAGFSPEKISPTTRVADDFWTFWNAEKEKNSKIPLDTRMVLLPEKCTEKVNVYEVNVQNFQTGFRLYGIACIPKAEGKYPALLRVPGAGVRPYGGDIKNAEKGYITFEMGIHGIPVTMPQGVYDNLRYGALSNYSTSNWDNRDNVYYRRVYLGCVRAIDYIFSLPSFDQKNLVVHGGSQGGALSIVTAALDDRVTGAISFYPALADMNGYLYDRAGGWPHFFRNIKDEKCILDQKEKTVRYYDVVNFARNVKVPVFFAFGYNDMVCPPTTSYAVYNVLDVEKTLHVVPEIEHYTYPEMWDAAWKWADERVGLK